MMIRSWLAPDVRDGMSDLSAHLVDCRDDRALGDVAGDDGQQQLTGYLVALLIRLGRVIPLVDAVGQWVPGIPPLIFVNLVIPQDRLRWTLMHEVGHFVLHHGSALSDIGPAIEDEANRFASEFLLPAREIRPQLYDLSLPKLAQLKRQWRVSMASLLKRAGDLGTITKRRAEVLWTEMGKAGYRTREPRELDVHGETPGAVLGEMLRLHREELGYSAEELAALFALRPDGVRSMYLPDEPATLRLVPRTAARLATS